MLNSIVEMMEDKNCKLEDKITDFTKSEQQREIYYSLKK